MTEDYPLGGMIEPYDIEKEKKLLFDIENKKGEIIDAITIKLLTRQAKEYYGRRKKRVVGA